MSCAPRARNLLNIQLLIHQVTSPSSSSFGIPISILNISPCRAGFQYFGAYFVVPKTLLNCGPSGFAWPEPTTAYQPSLQGYLARAKQHRPRALQQGYAQGPMVVLGRWAVAYERGTPLPQHRCLQQILCPTIHFASRLPFRKERCPPRQKSRVERLKVESLLIK